MAKKKKLVDKVRSKRRKTESKVNPFEVKFNRQKHEILGRKISKYDKGLPGLSRSKALKKRKETLLQEYLQRNKSNKFIDKRIGENDTNLSVQEKMMKRYALEKMRAPEKGGLFSLNDDEDLTHYGQSLSEIEKFDEPIISDDDDEEEEGRIGAKLVAEEHFGGGVISKREDGQDAEKTWKQRMEELIANSRKAKYERKSEKEEAAKLTEQVDQDWKQLSSLFAGSRNKQPEERPAKQVDDYDIAVRELKFDITAKATNRLKTDEEIAVEGKERLEKLEEDRIQRMRGILDEDAQPASKHRSADDLGDGLALYDPKGRAELSYDAAGQGSLGDGISLVSYLKERGTGVKHGNKQNKESPSEDESEDNASSGNDDDDDDDGEDDDKLEQGTTENSEPEDEDSASEVSEDSFHDLQSDEEDDATVNTTKNSGKQTESIKVDLKARKIMMEKARKELPYTFEVPSDYEALSTLIGDHSTSDQMTIITRMIKCHHPSLAEGNKQKLESLFALLLEYFCDLASRESPALYQINLMTRTLFDLAQISDVSSSRSVLDQLRDQHQLFSQISQRHGGRGMYPGLDTLLLLKLISVLYSTSDFQHSVVTPALVFITQILAQCPVTSEHDVTAGLFLCSLCLEYVSLSKRFIPEVINYLSGLLFLASTKDSTKLEKVVPPFKPVGKNISILEVTTDMSKNDELLTQFHISSALCSNDKKDARQAEEFRVQAVWACSCLLQECAELYSSLSSYPEIFASFKSRLKKLPLKHYPTMLQSKLKDILTLLDGGSSSRQPLVMQKRKPQMLKMFEPKVEDFSTFDGKKKRGGTKDFVQKQRLLHKHKREMKGAVREIRKDTQFLARHELSEQMEKDVQRKRKVQEIYQMLSSQEGEYRAMKRKKERAT